MDKGDPGFDTIFFKYNDDMHYAKREEETVGEFLERIKPSLATGDENETFVLIVLCSSLFIIFPCENGS